MKKLFKRWSTIILGTGLLFGVGASLAKQKEVVNVEAATHSVTITRDSFAVSTSAYETNDPWTATGTDGTEFNGEIDIFLENAAQSNMQTRSSKTFGDYFHNISPFPGAITEIEMVYDSGTARPWTPYASASTVLKKANYTADGTSLGEQTVSATSIWEVDASYDYRYVYLHLGGNGAAYLKSIKISYDTDSGPIEPAVKSVTVTPTSFTLDLVSVTTKQLTAEVATVGGASEEVTWTSENASIASVDNNGLVTAHAAGATTITATSTFDATKKGTATVTVIEEAEQNPILTGNSPYMNDIAYKMYLEKTQSPAGNYYFTGQMDSYYGGTSTTLNDGVDMYFEENGEGQNIYFLDAANAKNYIFIRRSGTHINFAFGTTVPDTAWFYDNETYHCMTYMFEGIPFTAGTYGSYDTFNATDLNQHGHKPGQYFMQFVSHDQEEDYMTYSEAFLSRISCDATGNTAPVFTHGAFWDYLALIHASLGEDAKTNLKNAIANDNGSDLQKAVAKYDYIVAKYGSSTYTNFMEREITEFAMNNVLVMRSQTTTIIISVAVLSVLMIGGFAIVKFTKKRKNN